MEDFCSEKKEQKTSAHWAEPSPVRSAQTRQSFLVLFFKKEPLTAKQK
jgi:hypothetical protein